MQRPRLMLLVGKTYETFFPEGTGKGIKFLSDKYGKKKQNKEEETTETP
ncbi:MAG: hypothetical protein IPH84_00465 [Bacteroidales bacterium]|nr:hypothetical protein [Bacteroidales bacterium]